MLQFVSGVSVIAQLTNKQTVVLLTRCIERVWYVIVPFLLDNQVYCKYLEI